MKKQQMMNIDRLSSLPDHVLLHILSLVGGDVKRVATTSVLSKRWQFLWVQLPVLEFYNHWDVEKTPNFVSRINRTLILRNKDSINLDTFKVSFTYDESYYPDLNVWVRFAVMNNVKQLSLLLSGDYYTLPQVLYSHKTLTSLCLSQCVVAPQLKIEWPRLTELTFHFVELPDNAIREIQSGCPALYKLALVYCHGFQRLDLNSRRLHELVFKDDVENKNDRDSIEISAPFLQSLTLRFSAGAIDMRLVDVESLVTADICYTSFGESQEECDTTTLIFEKIMHVKDIKVDSHFLYVLKSAVIDDGWMVPETSWKSLTVDNAWMDKDVFKGILILLQSSPNIQTLLIESHNLYEVKVKKLRNYLKCDLPHLKTVCLLDYADPSIAGEPMLTMALARILLKRATNLEKMEINTKGNLEEFPSHFEKMSKTVLSYPRSSEKAVVVLRQ